MHQYLRAIGFSNFESKKELQKLITDIVVEGKERAYTTLKEDTLIASFSQEFAPGIGITVCGDFEEEDKFTYEYYFPFLRGNNVTTKEDVTVERHSATESYAGVCDDVRIGVSLIFYLQNMIPYIKAKNTELLPIRGTSVNLSALSLGGTIMLPLLKTQKDLIKSQKSTNNRTELINAARMGDEEAMENLTLDDIDTYSSISKKIQKEDIFSLVDTTFMPYGIECDHYSILGEILEYSYVKNRLTDEGLCIMTVSCNDLVFDVCINKADLYGEPDVGRRFKGSIWMQGYINFPE